MNRRRLMGALTGACMGLATGLALLAFVGIGPSSHSLVMILGNSAFVAVVGAIFPDLFEWTPK